MRNHPNGSVRSRVAAQKDRAINGPRTVRQHEIMLAVARGGGDLTAALGYLALSNKSVAYLCRYLGLRVEKTRGANVAALLARYESERLHDR